MGTHSSDTGEHRLTRVIPDKGALDGCVALNKCLVNIHTHTHTHTFNGPLSGTTRVTRYQKGKTNLDFTETRDSEWQ